mmetsp:Transcript_44149/g.114815  ORF Transcript_44149/g.114815 Transcript_44149/m.114815 type:complete len:219 (-) Transcript_44149:423-1079(-)
MGRPPASRRESGLAAPARPADGGAPGGGHCLAAAPDIACRVHLADVAQQGAARSFVATAADVADVFARVPPARLAGDQEGIYRELPGERLARPQPAAPSGHGLAPRVAAGLAAAAPVAAGAAAAPAGATADARSEDLGDVLAAGVAAAVSAGVAAAHAAAVALADAFAVADARPALRRAGHGCQRSPPGPLDHRRGQAQEPAETDGVAFVRDPEPGEG